MNATGIHDWMVAQEQNYTEAKESEEPTLWRYQNSHGDEFTFDAAQFTDADIDARYVIRFLPNTETSASAMEMEQGERHPVDCGDTQAREDLSTIEWIEGADPETLGYDGPADTEPTDDEDEREQMREVLMDRLRDKHTDADGEFDWSSLKTVVDETDEMDFNPRGKSAEAVAEAIVEFHVNEAYPEPDAENDDESGESAAA